MKRIILFILSLIVIATTIMPVSTIVDAETIDTSGFKFNSIMVRESGSGNKVADLLNGETPSLKAGVTYSLDVEYSVPGSLQFSNTYLKVYLGNGLYVKTLPGATFNEGHIESTGFEELVKTPKGTGTSPYGYPQANSEKSKNGEMVYKTKNSLTNVSSRGEICFSIDEAYLNQDPNQILSNVIKVSLSTDLTNNINPKSFDVKSNEVYTYRFYTNQATEVVSKGGTTSTLSVDNVGGKSLTEENSKTSVEVLYPSDIEFVGLEEKGLYNKYGTVVSTVENNGIKTTTVEWDEPGSYSSGLSLYPHFKVPANSTRANGSSFNVSIKNFKKTIWNDTPDANRTSMDSEARMTVTIIDGINPEKITSHALVDTAPNWALKKYDTYNVRLGAFLVKNELTIETKKKTLELDIDETNTATIRGVTIPYHQDITYGKIHWTSSNGKSGTVDASIFAKSKVALLIKNTDLGLDINESIKTIKVDLGAIPGHYDGIKPMQDLLNAGNPNNKYVYDEFYGWSYISCGIYGSWKKETEKDVVSTVKLYNTGETPNSDTTHKMIGKSGAPEVLNGVGKIDKTQVMGGDSFKISGVIDDANWDWNPLQEPVLYVIMPEGFTYSNLKLTEGILKEPTYVGEFDKDGEKIKVWKYVVDIGEETRGQYQPNFTSKNMSISFEVTTDKRAKVGTYHINDFLGITTKDFAEIGAVIKAEKWDRSNWNTKKYTDVFGTKVNSGKDMVSLSEARGVTVQQAYEVTAKSELFIPKTGKSYIYDATSEETKSKTTPVLKNEEEAIMRVNVRNNTTTEINHATLFIPLLSENLDFGKAFMPEGKNMLPLELKGVEATSNFTIKYIKVKDSKQYSLNTSPKSGDYDEVTDPLEANMLMLVSKVAIAPGDGGRIDVKYKVGSNVTFKYNDAKDVVTPVLDYDINGNKSTLTKEPAAVSFYTKVVNISVSKKWTDFDGSLINDPTNKIAVELFQDGKSIAKKDISIVDKWNIKFENLDKINPATGKDYVYTVKESGLDKENQIKIADSWYLSNVSGSLIDGFVITNKKQKTWTPMIPSTTKLHVLKKWEGVSFENIKNEIINVRLYKNGQATDQVKVLNKDNKFTVTFDNLKSTDEITSKKNIYTVKEIDPDGNDLDEAKTLVLSGKEYLVHYDGSAITNTLVNPKISLTGKKIWDDANNQDGIRPDEVVIHLYANGNDTGLTTKATKLSAWSYSFNNLDTYDSSGDIIEYSVKEELVAKYDTSIEGTTITNKHIPAKINISVTKKWIGKEANSVKIYLLANGNKIESIILTSNNNWTHTFNLDQYKEGKENHYTIEEESIEGYKIEISGNQKDGFIVTNTYKEAPKAPKTGDNSNIIFYLGTMLISLISIIFIVELKKKYFIR